MEFFLVFSFIGLALYIWFRTKDNGYYFVVQVPDGDTLIVCPYTNKNDPQSVPLKDRRFTVRLTAIDAPETRVWKNKFPTEYERVHGIGSKAFLKSLVHQKPVNIRFHGTCKYGRKVARVFLEAPGERMDVSLTLIEYGQASYIGAWAQGLSFIERLRFSRAESLARKKSLGIWGNLTGFPF